MSICLVSGYFVFFFFKQKTAYEMRISDWSSDVCSSDLKARALTQLACIGLALGGSVGQNHAAALFDEQLGDRSPYSGCSTSDDRHFVAKSCHPGRFSFSIGLYRDEGFAADDLPQDRKSVV